MDYETWLEHLKDEADDHGLDLSLDTYRYHTYFMRGWSPECVIDDIRETVAGSDV
ncbi:hypothetical protein [Salinicola peritrichatus]|uniref:hypothetical protein n=1 Tax=Salinicola peritrichatus TaxID=1267424 RepID=UPI0013A628A5|nr:hypothetical protein [Salinicola peritrichatus]